MKRMKNRSRLAAYALMGLMIGGCLLSGTFVVTADFTFTASSGNVYFHAVDVTAESDWDDHKDKIDLIDAVGFEMTMDNAAGSAVTFNVYVAPWAASQAYTSKAELDAHASIIIEDLTVPSGISHMTYVQSLGHIKNLTALKDLAKAGKFHYYGVTSGSGGATFTVDPGKVIITFTASK
jgi:hypothetical protein